MQSEDYRQQLTNSIKALIEIREFIFEKTLNLAMEGDLKEWNSTVDSGEDFIFSKILLLSCNDTNVQMLTELLTKIEITCDTLENMNNLKIRRND